MKNKHYTKDHEWVDVHADEATIGITQYAVDELGDIVYIELPEVGRLVTKGDEIGTVESVKTVSSIYAPLSGTITRINNDLPSRPDIINESPDANGWIVAIKPSKIDEIEALLSMADYQTHCDTL
ncbi:glycine cleavage system protein H [bacterium]|jgi:glycine cleavage system H protein|nr:glycine cleavage system protein H [bacterium]|tara:strand:- start:215 stop:589 length:375 start_codon:yes stop_codon:yes gene_type:complete